MVDETLSGGGSTASTCPWCSASYTGVRETCPSCGAALAADPSTDPSLPGLTAIDTAAIVRAKTPVARPRNRILSWISGEYSDDVVTAAAAGALALPDADVRREMLRLELEAEVANLQAEADALMSEAAAEGRAPEVVQAAAALGHELDVASARLLEGDVAREETATEVETGSATESTVQAPPAAAPPPPAVRDEDERPASRDEDDRPA
jgi:hypothetical protein